MRERTCDLRQPSLQSNTSLKSPARARRLTDPSRCFPCGYSKSYVAVSLLFTFWPEPEFPATLTLGQKQLELEVQPSHWWKAQVLATSPFSRSCQYRCYFCGHTTVPGIRVPVYVHLEVNQTVFQVLSSLTEIII